MKHLDRLTRNTTIVTQYLQGLPTPELAATFGLSERTILGILRKNQAQIEEHQARITEQTALRGAAAITRARELLADATPLAADTLVDQLDSADPTTQRAAATQILDRAGIGPRPAPYDADVADQPSAIPLNIVVTLNQRLANFESPAGPTPPQIDVVAPKRLAGEAKQLEENVTLDMELDITDEEEEEPDISAHGTPTPRTFKFRVE